MIRNCPLAIAVSATFATHTAFGADSPHGGELSEIVVTAAPLGEGRLSITQPASVIAGDDLVLALAPTIGETVAGEPGISSTFFGPAASRPVIRGLGGDRVRVLTDGLATLDVSGVSEDHAVAIDPALADQVEILRGPATLLHGSGAAGGVVNIVTNRLHQALPDGASGLLEVRGDSALDERAIAGRFDTALGRVALHLDGVWRETDDYSIPGLAQSQALREMLIAAGEEPADDRGTVANSWSETRSGGVGATYVDDSWSLGLAWSRHDSEYGIPGGHGHEPGEHESEEDGLYIDLVQDRLDLAGSLELGGGSVLRMSAAANNYEHAEVEPEGGIGTLYEVDGRELRVALDHALPAGFTGTIGVQWQEVDLGASGEEAFVPDTRTRTLGAFLFEQRDLGPWSFEFGARIDHQEVAAPDVPGYDGTAVNLSAGLIRRVRDGLQFVGQLARTERHPSATELYADGPHAATGQYEIGQADFRIERGLQADLGLRGAAGVVTGEVRAFFSRYDGYLYLAPTGAEVDGLPVYEYRQQDARFHGFEALASVPLGAGGLALTLSVDAVRGGLADGGNLPRIPPLRVGAELSWQRGRLRTALSARHAFEQDRLAPGELPTDGYTLLDAELAWRPAWPDAAGTLLFLRASNLLDDEARVHASPLKDEVPLPGRSLSAGVRISFGR